MNKIHHQKLPHIFRICGMWCVKHGHGMLASRNTSLAIKYVNDLYGPYALDPTYDAETNTYRTPVQ